MSIAVIKTGGKQYKVSVGDKLRVEKLTVNNLSKNKKKNSKSNEKIEFEDILGGKKVVAEIIENGKEKKIKVFKFKPKKRYKRTYGHRQPYTQIEIKEIKWR